MENKGTEIFEQRIKFVDSQIPSPEARAKSVYDFIKEHAGDKFSNWDIICFCVNYLAFSAEAYPWVKDIVKVLNRYVYNAHYLKTEDLGLLK